LREIEEGNPGQQRLLDRRTGGTKVNLLCFHFYLRRKKKETMAGGREEIGCRWAGAAVNAENQGGKTKARQR